MRCPVHLCDGVIKRCQKFRQVRTWLGALLGVCSEHYSVLCSEHYSVLCSEHYSGCAVNTIRCCAVNTIRCCAVNTTRGVQ
ncbi:hypothetical protein M8J76_010989 [Diaphorina citri]|nr:hypothetical protein M8J75_010249 [Diaphorina citri]KAI5745428.1 hypothetical protein M8J76_010989 [Diaphorina citri]